MAGLWSRTLEAIGLKKPAPVEKRSSGFAAAAINRLTASLTQSSNGINSDLDGGLVTLRSRARGLVQNNGYAKRFISLVSNNVIGTGGPTLQVRAKMQNAELDKAANDAIEVHYKRWGKRCDITGRMTFAELQSVAIKAVARDGETIIRRIFDKKLPYGMALQVLEADRLGEQINQRLDNGNTIRQGVEIDGTGRPLAYWLADQHPGDNYMMKGGVKYGRVPAGEIYHLFRPERAEQVRGYSWLHAILLRMDWLHGFEDAAVVAARVGAAKMGVFTRTEESAPDGLNQMADAQAGGMLQMSGEAGEFFELPPGYSLESWNPEYPHQNFESFVKTCLRALASGLDVATHNLSGDMTDVNYSSARIAELSERDQWTMLQCWWIDHFLTPVYLDWLQMSLMRGDIRFLESGKSLPFDKWEKFYDASRFQGRTWAWVDPMKEAEAAGKLIEEKLTSRTAIAASQGREFEDIVDELEQEEKYLKAAGISLAPKPNTQPPVPPALPAGDKA